MLVEEQRSCRHITQRLNASKTRTPTGPNPGWQSATRSNIRLTRVYAGPARSHYRQAVTPQDRQTAKPQRRSLKTGRSYRAASEWLWSAAPALISAELCAKAQQQLQRTAATARKRSQPASGRYVQRPLVKCGAGGRGRGGKRQRRTGPTSHSLSYQGPGHAPLTVGQTQRCPAKLVRAERLATVVWHALVQ